MPDGVASAPAGRSGAGSASRARVIASRVVTVVLLTFVAFGSLFAIGETFDDPGGWEAVGLVALWVVPMTALVVLAVVRPALAMTVCGVAAAAVAIVILGSALGVGGWEHLEDRRGPIRAIALVALTGGIGALAWSRPRAAGRILTGLGAVTVLATAFERGSAPLRALGVPLLVLGALLWLLGPTTPTRVTGRRAPVPGPKS